MSAHDQQTPCSCEAYLCEDLIVPMHAHDARDDHFVSLAGPQPQRVSAQQAARIAAQHHGIADVNGLDDIVAGGPVQVDRSRLVTRGAAALGGLLAPHVLPRYSFADTSDRDTLIVVYLRGGMDGLSAVVPLDDPNYQAARGSIAVAPELTHPLTPGLGMHPAMIELVPMWDAGQLAFVLGVGGPWASRSHFLDQLATERFAPAQLRSGWLGRHLASVSSETGTLRGLTIGSRSTVSLATSFPTLALWSVDSFDLPAAPSHRDAALRALDQMYGEAGGQIGVAAGATFDAIAALTSIRATPYTPETEAVYPDTPFGSGVREIARMIKSDSGVEVACIDIGSWDMHGEFGRADDPTSKYFRMVGDLSGGLAALRTDLGSRWERTTVVTISEFGRRVALNGTGLDHGAGGLMMVAGGAVQGGQVIGSQPSLAPSDLNRGDLPITIDYRQPLSEIVTQRLGNPALSEVFPGFAPGESLGIV